MLNDIPLSILNPGELLLLSSRLREHCRDTGIPDPIFTRLTAALEEDEAILQEVLKRKKKDSYTGILQEKDALRDAAYLFFRDYVKAYVRSLDGAKQAAALQLQDLFEATGFSLQNAGYDRQTTLAGQLIGELEKPENRACLERLAAVPFFTEWVNRERDFQEAGREKEKLEARQDLPWLREARTRLSGHLDVALTLLGFYLEVEADRYAPLGKEIGAAAANLLKTARARQTRAESGEAEEPS